VASQTVCADFTPSAHITLARDAFGCVLTAAASAIKTHQVRSSKLYCYIILIPKLILATQRLAPQPDHAMKHLIFKNTHTKAPGLPLLFCANDKVEQIAKLAAAVPQQQPEQQTDGCLYMRMHGAAVLRSVRLKLQLTGFYALVRERY
jgi:hypothetical protein